MLQDNAIRYHMALQHVIHEQSEYDVVGGQRHPAARDTSRVTGVKV